MKIRRFNENKLPSHLQIDDTANISFGDNGTLKNCKVVEVHFEEDKVWYDFDVPIIIDSKEEGSIRISHIDSVVVEMSEGNSNESLVSKSDKGNRYFKMLKTGKFQHYDSPKGELSTFSKGEEDRKRLVSKLSKADKKKYTEWLKTPEGQKSLQNFK